MNSSNNQEWNGRSVAFLTLGCKVNSYETEAMQKLFEDDGFQVVEFAEHADIYVINTCTVTNIADRKSRQMLHKARKMNQNAIVVAVGCYVQAAKEVLEQDAAIDIIIGNNRKKDIIYILNEYNRGISNVNTENIDNIDSIDNEENIDNIDSTENEVNKESKAYTAYIDNTDIKINIDSKSKSINRFQETVIDISKEAVYEELSIESVAEKTRAYIKIQDGCNQFCSYCIIPYARGRVRSRSEEAVLKETMKLVQKGYKEIVLTGIHLSSYGVDFKQKDEEISFNDSHLLRLIVELSKIDGLERIRLGSLEPRIITEEFAKTLATNTKVCPHFHLSLQSGCDETLHRMNRKYSAKEYYEKCVLLRKHFDNPAITTDVIVGFPGETEEEFHETKDFLRKISFAQMHIFKYSVRKGTRAENMPNQVKEEIKTERSNILIALEVLMAKEYKSTFIDKSEKILVEESNVIDGQKYQIGHNERYLKLAFISAEDRNNQIIQGKVLRDLNKELMFCEIMD